MAWAAFYAAAAPTAAGTPDPGKLARIALPPADPGLVSRAVARFLPAHHAMSPAFFNRNFDSLHDTDTVAAATDRMLEHRVSDLPIVDADGRLVGIFTLDRLLAGLLPSAALVGYGVPDLAFIPDDLDTLRVKMRELESSPVRDFAVKPEHVVHPDTSPVEIVLQLYRGANNLPVVDRDSGRLVGMVSARDLLAVLHDRGGR